MRALSLNPYIDWDLHFDEMASQEYTVIDNFLPVDIYQKIHQSFSKYLGEDLFEQAGIGTLATYQINENYRSDQILWIDRHDCSDELKAYLNFISEDFIPKVNRELFTAIKDFEFMLAYYPSGGFYKMHLDQFKDRNNRILSMIIYLNDNWKEGDGGELVIYQNDEDKTRKVINPIGNRLAIFNSATIWHEVLPANKGRKSLTGWLLKMPQGLGFLG